MFFYLGPVQCLLRHCVMVASQFGFGEAVEGRVGRMLEEPLPGRYVTRKKDVLLKTMQRDD